MGRLSQDPWGSNGTSGSSRLSTWGVSGHAVEPWQMGATEGAGLDSIAMPPGFSNIAPRASAPALGGFIFGAPGNRNVAVAGAFEGAGVGSLNGGKSQQGLQTELQMKAELSRVKRERDVLEKRLREIEAAKASLPLPPLPPSVMPPPAAPAAADMGMGRAAAADESVGSQAARGNAKAPRESAAKPERKQDAALKKRDLNSKARVRAAETNARAGLLCNVFVT